LTLGAALKLAVKQRDEATAAIRSEIDSMHDATKGHDPNSL